MVTHVHMTHTLPHIYPLHPSLFFQIDIPSPFPLCLSLLLLYMYSDEYITSISGDQCGRLFIPTL